MKEGLSIVERLQIVREAERLISLPDTFLQGAWKCPVYERPKTHEKVQVLTSSVHQTPDPLRIDGLNRAKDDSGRPLFAYCVEGAINQAGLNILGGEKAIMLGAAQELPDGSYEIAENETFSEYLSVNEVARVMFAEIFVDREGEYWDDEGGEASSAPARYINDLDTNESEGAKERAHRRIMHILSRRIEQLRDSKLAGV